MWWPGKFSRKTFQVFSSVALAEVTGMSARGGASQWWSSRALHRNDPDFLCASIADLAPKPTLEGWVVGPDRTYSSAVLRYASVDGEIWLQTSLGRPIVSLGYRSSAHSFDIEGRTVEIIRPERSAQTDVLLRPLSSLVR